MAALRLQRPNTQGFSTLFLTSLVAMGLSACSSCEDEAASVQPTPPEEMPVLVEALPENVEYNEGQALLGRLLFHDPILSGDGTISCATCHSMDHGGAEPRVTSTGINGAVGPINSPTVLNSSFNFVQFWDGRAATLEEQVEGPVANPIEMGASWDDVVAAVAADERYAELFGEHYEDGVTQANITHAIAEYERSLVTPIGLDAYLRGDETALTGTALAGWNTFREVGCTACHQGVNIGGTMYQKLGVVRNYFEARGGELTEADQGRFNVTGSEDDRHRFKVPTLRNIALTAPYLHDGTQETLSETVRLMGRFQLGREFTDRQVEELVSFLESLTGELPDHAHLPEDELPDRAAPADGAGARDTVSPG